MVCCTASRLPCPDALESGYVQGAADDSESWAHGLTPSLFWAHSKHLLNSSGDQLPALIHRLRHLSLASVDLHPAILIRPTTTIFIGATPETDLTPFEGMISCRETSIEVDTSLEIGKEKANTHTLILPCGSGKLGSRALRSQLSRVPPFIAKLRTRSDEPKILFTCSTGKDLSAGVALVVLCLYFDEKGEQIFTDVCPLNGNLMRVSDSRYFP